MSDIIDTVQLQETEDALVTLFEITLPSGTVAYFFDGLDDGTNNIRIYCICCRVCVYCAIINVI